MIYRGLVLSLQACYQSIRKRWILRKLGKRHAFPGTAQIKKSKIINNCVRCATPSHLMGKY